MRGILIAAMCVLFLFVANTAQAASFDCGAAKTKVEHLICDDKTISDLDTSLDNLYRSTLDTAQDPKAVVAAQKDWVRQRNRCADASCVGDAYRNRMAALAKVPTAGWKTYSDARLGISFEYLGNRRVKPCAVSAHGQRCVMLLSRDMPNSDYLMAFDVVDGSLERVAEDTACMAEKDGKWVTSCGMGSGEAVERFSGPGWKGMKAIIPCGISDKETGFHAAAGDCLWAVVSNDKRSVVVDTQGIVGTDSNTLRSLNSLRFEP
jgi:uncharacterized protein